MSQGRPESGGRSTGLSVFFRYETSKKNDDKTIEFALYGDIQPRRRRRRSQDGDQDHQRGKRHHPDPGSDQWDWRKIRRGEENNQ